MSQETWSAVDEYISDRLIPRQPALEAALETSAAQGLPEIRVGERRDKLLHPPPPIPGARRIRGREPRGGNTTFCLAGAPPADGRLVTVEFEERHAAVARDNIA